jgi:hypothetical protein
MACMRRKFSGFSGWLIRLSKNLKRLLIHYYLHEKTIPFLSTIKLEKGQHYKRCALYPGIN